jgi:predicted MFS family arabinose efflux permease
VAGIAHQTDMSPRRAAGNVALLGLAQALSTCAPIVVTLLGGIVGTRLAPEGWSTLPMSVMIITLASGSIPASMLMRRIGRRAGFVGGGLLGAIGALVVAMALYQESFVLLCTGTMLMGVNGSFAMQYRFAAAESVALHNVSRAISGVLLGTVLAAWAGPELAARARLLVPDVEYAGSFFILAAFLLASAALVACIREPEPRELTEEGEERPLSQVFKQPVLIIAVMSAAVGYGVMNLVMTATPISMHVMHGHSIDDTAMVIQSHVLAMYLPSLASGLLIGWLGIPAVMAMGVMLLGATVVAGLSGHEIHSYWLALVSLGVGSTLLTRQYRASERFKVQAANDVTVFGASALGSLLAGRIVFLMGWETLMYTCLPLLAIMSLAIIKLARLPKTAAAQAGGKHPITPGGVSPSR